MSVEVSQQGDDDVEDGVRRFQAQVNAEYARLMPNGPRDISQRRSVAEQVRAPWATGGPEMAETLNLRVGDRETPIRIHRPTPEPDLPALIYVHGGGWSLFSVDTHDRLMREYAARAGLTVIGINYSLAPEHPFPVPIDEIVSVVRWLRSSAGIEFASPRRIAVGGDSAGANLSVAANLALRDAGEPLLDAMLLNYGAFDPEPRGTSYDLYGGPRYMLTPDEMAAFWADYLPAGNASDPLARPLLANLSGLPPTFLCIAACDILADENRELAQRLCKAGVDVTARIYEGATHSFLEAVSVSPLAARALCEASEWLRRMLRA